MLIGAGLREVGRGKRDERESGRSSRGARNGSRLPKARRVRRAGDEVAELYSQTPRLKLFDGMLPCECDATLVESAHVPRTTRFERHLGLDATAQIYPLGAGWRHFLGIGFR